jgi:predicted Zn-dependent protease
MENELKRSMENLQLEGHENPYFLSYHITDQTYITIEGSLGTITQSDESRSRNLSVNLRVGSHKLDNSGVEEPRWEYDEEKWRYRNIQVPIEDDPLSLKHKLWLATDYEYKKALEDYSKKKKDIVLKPEERPDDFTVEKPTVFISDEAKVTVDKKEWEQRIKRYSTLFKKYEGITISSVRFGAKAKTSYFVNSEGTKIQDGNVLYSIKFEAETRAKDGMPLRDSLRLYSYDGVWEERKIENEMIEMAEGLVKLKEAKVCESYAGPVLIKAPASGVFISAVLVPMLKADKKRWKEDEGLQNKIGERILSPSISVYDDPTIKNYKGEVLAGYYRFDEEGVEAHRVSLIEKGVLKNLLLSRSPVKGFDKSNGHGRANVGQKPEADIGNLIMESSSPQSFHALKSRLIKECKKQGRPYGLLIASARIPEKKKEDSQEKRIPVLGGFEPIEVYKVYTNGKEEIVRGAQILAGSPLATLSKIIALGNDSKPFDASFGKSSVAAPSILVSEMEARKTKEGLRLLPILPRPE